MDDHRHERLAKMFLLQQLISEGGNKLREMDLATQQIARIGDMGLSYCPNEHDTTKFKTVEDAFERANELRYQMLESARVNSKCFTFYRSGMSLNELEHALADATNEVEEVLGELEDEKKEAARLAIQAKLEAMQLELDSISE